MGGREADRENLRRLLGIRRIGRQHGCRAAGDRIRHLGPRKRGNFAGDLVETRDQCRRIDFGTAIGRSHEVVPDALQFLGDLQHGIVVRAGLDIGPDRPGGLLPQQLAKPRHLRGAVLSIAVDEALGIPLVAVFLRFKEPQIRRQASRDNLEPVAAGAVLVVAGRPDLDRCRPDLLSGGFCAIGVLGEPLLPDLRQRLRVDRLRGDIAVREGHSGSSHCSQGKCGAKMADTVLSHVLAPFPS